MCVAFGFMLLYVHLLFAFNILLVLLMLLLMFLCCSVVISCGNFVKLFWVMNSSVLLLQSSLWHTTVLPLLALVMIYFLLYIVYEVSFL
jgi:hypothetical protein